MNETVGFFFAIPHPVISYERNTAPRYGIKSPNGWIITPVVNPVEIYNGRYTPGLLRAPLVEGPESTG